MPVRNAVFITATELEPRRYGKPVVIGGIIDHLCERLGPAQVHVILIGRPDLERPPVAYQRHVISKPRWSAQIRAVVEHTLFARGERRLSLQESALHSDVVAARLRELLDRIDPELEIWDTVRLGQYASAVPRRGPGRPARRLLYADDLFSERYTAMLRDSATRALAGDPGGAFKKLLPRPVQPLLGNPLVYRPLLQLERRLVAVSEETQPKRFDGTYLVGPEEAARLRERCPGPIIAPLPPLLREPRASTRAAPSAPVFTFVGGFDYAPNRDGITWFLEVCREAVLARLPDVVIQVIGNGTEVGLPEAAAWGDRVRFLGWVDDLDAVLGGSVALLSSLRTGSGVKIKVLEALARGLPVVATPSGVQGIEANEGSGCLIAETPEALAAAMQRACEPSVNARLSEGARRAWNQHYSPAVVRRQYDEIFGLGEAVSRLEAER
ncbi:MAG TPA: glycosyltransferase family 4 protein [Polyangiales bacterium]|nr:glycosyltransferase family 4 protein [Polyangiales bacterium]